MGDRCALLQRHQPLGQQAHGPALPPRRRRATGQRDKVRLLGTVQLARIRAVGGLARQRGVQPRSRVLLPHAGDRGRVDLQRGGDRQVGPRRATLTLVALQEEAGMGQRARRGAAAAHQRVQPGTLHLRQGHHHLLRHRALSPSTTTASVARLTRHLRPRKSWLTDH